MRRGEERFELFFSRKISTKKKIQDVIIPLRGEEAIEKMIVRGDFNQIQLVIYAHQ